MNYFVRILLSPIVVPLWAVCGYVVGGWTCLIKFRFGYVILFPLVAAISMCMALLSAFYAPIAILLGRDFDEYLDDI